MGAASACAGRAGCWPGSRSARSNYAKIAASISPHTLRHFMFTWLKTQGIDDALIQPYSGHATRQSLELYSRLALIEAQQRYRDVIGGFLV
jgi:integrase/recombinase XerD